MTVKVTLPNEKTIEFKKALRRSGRREMGGILMGEQFGPNNFKIVDFTIDDKIGSEAHFCRNPEEHLIALEQFFAKTNHDYSRYNYLGEWHSHPTFTVEPSLQDIIEMNKLVRGEPNIHFAVLLIVRLRWYFKLDAAATIYSSSNPEEVELSR
ncbi:Mov34/MPN/PAD-1 family protein [Desulforhopalus sp. 52FAK]